MKSYNGPQSQLMDELIEALNQRVENRDFVFDVYFARACKTLENQGWKKSKIEEDENVGENPV